MSAFTVQYSTYGTAVYIVRTATLAARILINNIKVRLGDARVAEKSRRVIKNFSTPSRRLVGGVYANERETHNMMFCPFIFFFFHRNTSGTLFFFFYLSHTRTYIMCSFCENHVHTHTYARVRTKTPRRRCVNALAFHDPRGPIKGRVRRPLLPTGVTLILLCARVKQRIVVEGVMVR